jgi:enoyl-CoA hydratase/carnithine racemase
MDKVLLECADGVARITLNRPQARNALNLEMCNQLLSIMSRVNTLYAQHEVRAVILEGVGPAFCAGADLKERSKMTARAMSAHSQLIAACADRLADLACPTIAAIEGAALGGGFELALACDLRIAANEATFGFPEVTYGFFPGAGGPARLTRLVGYSVAVALLMTARQITGDEAERLHIVHMCTPRVSVQQAAIKEAHNLARFAPEGIRSLRSLLALMDRPEFERAQATARQMRDALNHVPVVSEALNRFGK